MNKKEYFEYIVPIVEPMLSKYGLTYKKSKDAFIKKIDDGWIKVSFVYYQFALTNNVNIGFEIRRNSVEEIYVHYIDMNPSGYKETSSIGFSLGHLLNIKDAVKVFRFTTINELNEIIETFFIPFLEKTVPDFIERYSNLENIYLYLSKPDIKNPNQFYPLYSDLVRALIIYRLLNRSDFEATVIHFDQLLKKLKEQFPSSLDADLYDKYFNKLVDYLRSI